MYTPFHAESIRRAEADHRPTSQSLPDLEQLLADPATDSELRSLASDELAQTNTTLATLTQSLKTSLIPPHPFAHLPCILEIRPGTGGDEAALFASSLLRMYQAHCKIRSRPFNILSLTTAAATSSEDRLLEVVAEVPMDEAYELLRCEAGVHRVQRVPATEAKGRTHTSTATVLVLPSFPTRAEDSEKDFEDPESDYYVNVKDVRTDTMRASGAGGQHVNMTDSAVRLTHLPTGTVVSMQTSRSQHKNREDAWRLLRSRLAAKRREEREEEMGKLRSSIAGGAKGGRADKIRTYNWGQQRVTDHRSGVTLNRLDDVLEGGPSLDEIMASVKEWMKDKELEALIAEEEAASAIEAKSTKRKA